jgi:hypothetical protein
MAQPTSFVGHADVLQMVDREQISHEIEDMDRDGHGF